MGLFKKSKEINSVNQKPVCITELKVLGSGCAKCNELESNAQKALDDLGIDIRIDHVTDFAQIASYGVMATPALVADGKVICYGRVLKTKEIIELLQK